MLLSPPLWAFESHPEFQWLSSNEASVFDDPWEINAEYSSDYLTFLPPLTTDSFYLQNREVFDLSTGSLGSKEFMVRDRLKLSKHLIDQKFEFRFHYINEQDYESSQLAHILELIFWKNKWGLSLFGETSFEKSEDDAGLAILYQPQPHHEFRLWAAFADFSRNKRNNENDKFVDGHGPKAYGFVGRLHKGEDQFLQYSLRVEDKVHWLFPDSGYEYRFSRYHVGLSGRQILPGQKILGFRWQYDRKFESRTNSRTVDRKRFLSQMELDFFRGIHLFRPGVAYFYRDYRQSDRADVFFRHTLPYLWMRFRPKGPFTFRRNWWLGLEATYPEEARPEYRSNLKYEMKFSDHGQLSLLFTFDMDEFGSGSTWEGGNAQFTLVF